MNKLVFSFVLLFSLIFNNLYCQDIINTKFYNYKIPVNTTIKLFASTHEELSNIDAYQFITNEKPKYILYLVSNKTNKDIASINIDNYNSFLFDLGDLNILSVDDLDGEIKISFTYKDNESIKGIIYASVNNDILNRYVFLISNENARVIFQKEIDEVKNSIKKIKSNW